MIIAERSFRVHREPTPHLKSTSMKVGPKAAWTHAHACLRRLDLTALAAAKDRSAAVCLLTSMGTRAAAAWASPPKVERICSITHAQTGQGECPGHACVLTMRMKVKTKAWEEGGKCGDPGGSELLP